MISTIKNNLETRILASLIGYSKLSFINDLKLNKFGNQSKRFSVKAMSANSNEGQVGINTLDHKFEITLTDSYAYGATSQLNDDMQSAKTVELQDNSLILFKSFQLNKASISSNILIINELSLKEVEYLNEEKIAVLKFEINIKYKI